jgi:hypothetical protein
LAKITFWFSPFSFHAPHVSTSGRIFLADAIKM